MKIPANPLLKAELVTTTSRPSQAWEVCQQGQQIGRQRNNEPVNLLHT